jgi:signal transduction histidine kinase/CheY-like chemotaxis protein
MAKVTWWIIVSLLCCWFSPVEAALPVPQDRTVLRDSGELYFLRDSSNALTLQQVRADDSSWQRVDTQTKLEPVSDIGLWLRLQIEPPAADRALILMQAMPRQGILDVYIVRNGNLDRSYQTGNKRPFASRPLPFPEFLFPFELRAQDRSEIYIHVLGFPRTAFDYLQLWPQQKLLVRLPIMNAFEWLNIGVMAVLALAALVLWLFVRQRLLGLFVLFVAVQLLAYIVARGYGFWWFWPNSPAFERIASLLITPLGFAVNGTFLIAFLDLRRYAPRLHRATVIGLVGLVLIVAPLLLWRRDVRVVALASIPIFYLSFLGISFWLWRRRRSGEAGVFLVCGAAYFVVICTAAFFAVYSSGAWYSIHLIDVAQQQRVLLFAICLGYRFRQTVRSEESARAEARTKSEFLARMSHEIRTPMNGILGMSELLRDAGLNNTQRRYNDIVYASATSLLTVINDILDFSKIQAGRMTVEKVPFDLHRLAVDALTLFRLKADEKNLELLCDIELGVPAWVMGDPTRIRQILINFLSNAVKFTEAGEIRLHIANSGDNIRIAIEDTGPGIARDVQTRLFESFMQADASIARSHGGTGLGLAITRQLAELMGGTVDVHSRIGAGSTFWVELPLPATAVQEPLPPAHELSGKSILVVDDNVHFCELIGAHIKSWGMQLQIAHNGADALAFVRAQKAKGHCFDLISIDLKMPGMNGLELAHALKAEYGAALPPLLLLTATTDIPQSATRRAAGLVLAQEKPLLAADLREAFARALGLAALPSHGESPLPSTEVPRHALTILIVEDNPTNQIVIQSMLQKLGHDCLLATHGTEAMMFYETRHAEFDLILMDCEMPGMSGYEATQIIRTYEDANSLPRKSIVALTAHTLDEHIKLCYDAGMDGHLAKPLSLDQLRKLLAPLAAIAVAEHK